jgi:membrane associated rhomboid family serine protease
MSGDLRVVFESRSRRACKDRALVLASARIPYQLIEDAASCALVVPAEHSPRAADELRLYEEENPPQLPRKPVHFEHQDGVPGVVAYLLVVCFVGWMAGESTFSRDWLTAGRIDGELLRAGEWWRSVTALTLHSGLRHLAGNIIFGTFFGLFAGRLLGPGVAWLVILLAGAAGNTLNTLLLESSHRSIGASTGVFAALGLLAGFVWRGKLMSQERWTYRVGPIVGGLALLMYTGTGDANTDIGAHLMGFVCGFGGGLLLAPVRDRLGDARLQRVAAASAVALIVIAWASALTT